MYHNSFPGECSTGLCGHKQAQENTTEKNSSVQTSVHSLSRSIAACIISILSSCLVMNLFPRPTQPGTSLTTIKLSSSCHLQYGAVTPIPQVAETCQLLSEHNYVMTGVQGPSMHVHKYSTPVYLVTLMQSRNLGMKW